MLTTKWHRYGRAEGVNALYIKRLDDAIRDGDPIRSIIRGTAVNSNGRTPGISQSSIDGQISVARKAYDQAGLKPSDTAYVEMHGTGTAVGDVMVSSTSMSMSQIFFPVVNEPMTSRKPNQSLEYFLESQEAIHYLWAD